MIYTTIDSPIGELLLAGEDDALCALHMDGKPSVRWARDDDAFPAAREQLAEYFAGHRRDFDRRVPRPGIVQEPFRRLFSNHFIRRLGHRSLLRGTAPQPGREAPSAIRP